MKRMKEIIKTVGKVLNKGKPYVLMLALQFGMAGSYIFAMDSANRGMNRFVFIVYRNAMAAFALAPFAFFFERKIKRKMTFCVFFQITALAFLEPVLDQGFTFLGMKYTSATFASAIMNAVPSVTFVVAARTCKYEGVTEKVIGTLVTFGGALLMTLYKGPIVHLFPNSHNTTQHQRTTGTHWVAGTLFILLGCVAWSFFFILQTITVKRYPAEISLACLICLAGALQTAVVALVADRHPRAWAIGWDYRLFGPLYTGLVSSGFTYYVQGLVSKSRGPVFLTAFNPLCMFTVAALGSLFLSEQLHIGSVMGGIIIAVGVYSVVWGKGKDYSDLTLSSSTPTTNQTQQLPITSSPTHFSKVDTALTTLHHHTTH